MTNLRPTWRLLYTPPSHGAWNMAVDEAILEFTGRGIVPPTLRLFAWFPACLSLGYAQSFQDVDLEKLSNNGWDLVRRPTGGRAILHTDELTYSVCGPNSESHLSGGVLESYQNLARALLMALEQIGINADSKENLVRLSQDEKNNPVCFEVPSNYEITVNGKKLIGSAQARKKDGVLQHGSLPLRGDLTRIIQVLNFPDYLSRAEAGRRLLDHATTVENVLGYPGDWWVAAQAFHKAFSTVLEINLELLGLTVEEGERAMEFYTEKYNNPGWTEKN
jgi:lipoate-protein ligase A